MAETLDSPPAHSQTDPLLIGALVGLPLLLSACGGGDMAEMPAALQNAKSAVPTSTVLQTDRRKTAAVSKAVGLQAPTPDAMMNWAQSYFPNAFPGSQSNIQSGILLYRYYPDTGNYLGVAESIVYVLGPITAGELVNVGRLEDFAALVSANRDTAAPSTDAEAARFLLQAQFSASEADIAAVRTKGYKTWLTEQFAAPATITGFAWLDARGYNQVESVYRYYDNSYPGDYMIWNQLMTSGDAVRKRCALALSEFFVVSLVGLDFSWRSHAIAAWWDLLVANAFGNYRQLLEAVSLNPAMGYYLNTKGNRKEDVARNRVPDENYGREVMQLFSLGVHQLNLDGTEKLDASGARLESYTQSDITNLARVFTGWDIDQSQNVPTLEPVQNRTIPSTHYTRLPMVLNAANHSTLAATFLGATVPAGTTGVPALKIALDTLFNHPNVGPFFGKQMIQRLVTSNPSPAYVARVASAFNNNGAGVRGDLQAVFAAVLLDDEARGAAGLTDTGFGRLREPIVRLVQWGRSFGITSARGSWKMGDLSNPGNRLGQSPLRSPTVFNFFRPGYIPPSTALSATKTPAPEFQLVNESSVGGYLNYMQGVIRSGIYVNAPDQSGNGTNATNGYDIKAAYIQELGMVLDPPALLARLNLLLCAGQLSAANQTLIINALNATSLTINSSDNAKRDRLAAAILLVMASSDYLIQK